MKQLIIILACLLTLPAASQPKSIRNGELWLDESGSHINAHGGGVLKYGDTYYWFGEHKDEHTSDAMVGVMCYASKDLVNWRNCGVALSVTEPAAGKDGRRWRHRATTDSDIERGCILERPKVIYNKVTGKFCMWFHLELKGRGYDAARYGVAVADRPEGPYQFLYSSRANAGTWPIEFDDAALAVVDTLDATHYKEWTPAWFEAVKQGVYVKRDFEMGQMSRDMTLYVDDDGKAYHIFSSEENLTLHIAELSDDYLHHTGRYTRVAPAGHNEAPAIFKHEDTYWMITSGCTGWAPNEARMFSAPSIWGPWTQHPNPCRGPKAEITFGGQSTFVLPVSNRSYIFMADIWRPHHPIDARYIWLPIEFEDGKPMIRWRDEWEIGSLGTRAQDELKLWYDRPAEHWNSALPLGNGRIGAMVFGSPTDEEFQLNEETISKGSPYDNYPSTVLPNLQQIRDYVFADRSDLAQALADSVMMFDRSKGKGAPYQPAGSLRVQFDDHDGYTNYRRELDISNALSRVTYDVKGVTYTEEAFTSFTDQLFVIRYTASKPKQLNFSARLTYPTENVSRRTENGKTLVMTGTTEAAGRLVPGGIKFRVDAHITNKDGKVTAQDTVLNVKGASEVIIYVAMATNFVNYHDISANPDERIAEYMKNAGRDYDAAKTDHIAFYKKQFDRVSLKLTSQSPTPKQPNDQTTSLPNDQKPTDERIRDFASSNDLGLVETYFQFGRYLMISSSQPSGQPTNLQGIWNGKMHPAWSCRYTTNINAEMNYWPAEPCNLPELHEPFIRMARELSEKGRGAARTMYGCRGWVTHHNTDLWRMTGAVDHAYSGAWPMAGAWICQHVWQKYLYSGDKDYLRSVYPIMKGASEFFVDFLVKDPRTGYQVVCPSVSPENSPKLYRKGQNIFAGITMDNQLVSDLFTNTAAAARVLRMDSLFTDTLINMRSQLTPLRIGQHGQLQEWAEDWDNPNDHHRHVSHLWGLYPGAEISQTRSPEAFEAVKTSLIQRGDPSTGWSMGWKVCLWARLLDGNHAYRLIKNQLSLVPAEKEKGTPGGTYPNMFDAHPPFQIDGNFGCTAGIAEMLVQSHDGFVHLLPALPDDWSEGEVCGLRTIGGFVIERLAWKDGKLTEARIRSTVGGNLRLRLNEKGPLELCSLATRSNLFACQSKNGTQELAAAQGANPNPLFAVYTMPVQQRKDDHYTPLPEREPSLEGLYDIPTKAGETIVITD